jgi:hypothetical protein
MMRFIRNLLSRFNRPAPARQAPHPEGEQPVAELEARRRRAAETILQNERLTAGLQDAVAQALLDWGLAMAGHVASSTAGLDDRQAEPVLETRLQAVARLMRRVRAWLAGDAGPDAAPREELLAYVVEQGAIVYGDLAPPAAGRRAEFLSRWQEDGSDPIELVARLRALVEETTAHAKEPEDDSGAMEDRHDT